VFYSLSVFIIFIYRKTLADVKVLEANNPGPRAVFAARLWCSSFFVAQ